MTDREREDDLNFFGLGEEVRGAVYSAFNIVKLHKWQTDTLKPHISEGRKQSHALVLAPTSGGKTLVSLIILLRSMVLLKKDTILALPLCCTSV